MTTLWQIPWMKFLREEVSHTNPLAAYLPEDDATDRTQPPVAGRSVFRQRTVPGIATGAAYQDGDVMGTVIEFPNVFRPSKLSGLLLAAAYYDLDDEGLAVDLHLFARPITSPGADNAAFTPTDAELLALRATCTFPTTAFFNFASNQIAWDTRTQPISSESTSLWGFAVTRGALNIAAANLPAFGLAILPD